MKGISIQDRFWLPDIGFFYLFK
uniref:Uncharacterized protein n=1 Tax=Rhizophora mucronata TaxID=61149 RepID=A0A2P2P7P2_RHIMU